MPLLHRDSVSEKSHEMYAGGKLLLLLLLLEEDELVMAVLGETRIEDEMVLFLKAANSALNAEISSFMESTSTTYSELTDTVLRIFLARVAYFSVFVVSFIRGIS